MSELPAGWRTSALADLVETVRGVTYNKSQARDSGEEGLMPILRANNIKSGIVTFDDLVFVPEECVSSTQTLAQGDIVVAMSSGSRSVVGKSAQLTTPWQGSFGAFCGVLRTATDMDARYLYYFTQSRAYRDRVSELAAGVNINNLKPVHFENIPTPVAPLREQERIAQKLDALLAQVDTLKARIDAIPALLKRFRQATLEAAAHGSLLAENKPFQVVPLSQAGIDIQIGPFGSLLHKHDYVDGGVPLVNPMHIANGRINTSPDMTVSPEKARELSRYRMRAGDVVLGRRGEMGRAAVVKDDRLLCGTGSIVLRPAPEAVDSNFLQIFLSSPSTTLRLSEGSVGTTMINLNQKALSKLAFPGISLQAQNGIVRRVEQLFAFADQLEARVAASQKRIDTLTQSLLAKAFRGELVPQDPSDEPASVLLERIRAQRAAASKPKRGSRAAAR